MLTWYKVEDKLPEFDPKEEWDWEHSSKNVLLHFKKGGSKHVGYLHMYDDDGIIRWIIGEYSYKKEEISYWAEISGPEE